jgi:mono/diheme cytochrome c family protein
MTRFTLGAAAAASAAGVLLAVAGAGSAATPTKTTAATAAPAKLTAAQRKSGIAAFRKAGCAGCHTLAAAGAVGTRGPNFDGLYFPIPDMIRQVTNGSSYMPSFKGVLTPQQIKDVVAWVDAVRLVKHP